MSTIASACRRADSSDHKRHVVIICAWMKEHIESGDQESTDKPTEEMAANILDKPLLGEIPSFSVNLVYLM